MPRSAPARVFVALVAVMLCLPPASQTSVGQSPAADVAPARLVEGTKRVYDTSILHRVDVVLAATDADRFVERRADRLHATVTFDGQMLRDIGVRQSGGVYHAYQPVSNKPSLSLKFDEFVKGQTLHGLTKLILKNELQDLSFLSEHLTYEIFRRAGLAAPLTAHARVTINGIDNGIYLLREPINKQFLARNFGAAETDGDLYEIENTQDFVFNPSYAALDDEGVKGRTRVRIERLAAAVMAATPESFERTVGPLVDLNRLVTYVAAEMATGHWDGLVSRNNNVYMYARESDGRFIFLPWGADQALGISRGGGRFGGGAGVQSMLVRKLLDVPTLAARVQTEGDRIQREPVWSAAVLTARIDAVAAILATGTGASGRTAVDLDRFASWRPTVQAVVVGGRAGR